MVAAPPGGAIFDILWPRSGQGAPARLARGLGLAMAGALALTLSAKAQVPLFIPITLQSLVVLLLGGLLGARLGLASVMLYLGEGAANLPVFAGTPEKGLGLAYMMGPTGGYLVGFALAALLIGYAADRRLDGTLWRRLLVMSLGHLVIFAFGYAWLVQFVGYDKAWLLGVAPFYAATVIKTLLAALLATGLCRGAALLRGL
ncbi:MAG: biotin transporter BioY [Hyphomicrobiales bacterium]|nr:biotin transporter BioY [Hyphomicrobiales bacterium]